MKKKNKIFTAVINFPDRGHFLIFCALNSRNLLFLFFLDAMTIENSRAKKVDDYLRISL
jgi:hypothetical protein